jgi:gluconolactonase
VVCYNNKGEQIDIIEMPERVSNVEFGGQDGKTLFITASTSVYMADLNIKGAKFI